MQFSAGCLLFVLEAAPVAHAAWIDNRSRTAAWRQGSGDPAAEGPETAEVQAQGAAVGGQSGDPATAEERAAVGGQGGAQASSLELGWLASLCCAAAGAGLLVGLLAASHIWHLGTGSTTTNIARIRMPNEQPRRCGCGTAGCEFAASYSKGEEAGLCFRGWAHNWCRVMAIGGGEPAPSTLRLVGESLLQLCLPRRSKNWPPYCCPQLVRLKDD